jgi:hypothetical protein
MSSGGARVRSGPAPDPQALRRDRDASDWQRWPATRTAPAPTWPLARATKRELVLWAREWTRGEANAWQAYGMEVEVAMYVRNLREVEKAGSSATARNLLLRQMDSLGLTVGGKAKNRWIIAADGIVPRETPEDDETPEPTPRRPVGPSAKERLAGQGLGVLDGGA